MIAAACLIAASIMPAFFVGCVLLYAHIYGVSIKAAFYCVLVAWMEPL